MLELSLIVAQVALSFNYAVFVLGSLCGKLCKVGLVHLAYIHHSLAALLVGLTCFQALLAHVYSLVRVENLNIQLCYLLQHVVGSNGRVELGLLGSKLV